MKSRKYRRRNRREDKADAGGVGGREKEDWEAEGEGHKKE